MAPASREVFRISCSSLERSLNDKHIILELILQRNKAARKTL
jgi:hypothetical protein